ncbi:hypothetical protein GCM10008171_27680 [Methylopila jiangsuensis]|uniref:histidine kinase n=1 Tax=Methylopila jiangsuensis TaxID=586230 RepID=A0A9W6N3X6_9HYPH|nr:response regulator [Methylopila jiangsuensis]MDR6285099.1 CheY-like chemotaxis protein [Methylopila jiangsuensis]GLK77514.1 hypothetical protein GCM10008171_27680 [Methylopila jiangsuensis]
MSATASFAEDCEAPDPARRIAVAAHEIRTPLGGILALADLLLAEELSEAARGHAAALKTSAEHLLSVASALLGADMAPRRAEEVELDAFLARVAPALEARARSKALDFTVLRAPGAPARVIANEAALRQIVENLADNALRATASGSVSLAIEPVACDGAEATLRIVVRDTGPGLGPTPERLFQPFVQGESARGAAGLGLALVAEIARGMGGGVEARNRPEGGAEVAARLRLAMPRRPAPAGRPRRVLVAEDNAVNRRVIATLLEHFDLAFDMAMDGAEALAAVSAGGYDLVLMDATMPTLDGLEATRAIRALPAPHGAIRVVGVTARAFPHEIAAFRAAGADEVVTKPLSVAELWRAIAGEAAAV